MPNPTISIRLDPDLLKRVDAAAKARRRSRSLIVREAVEKEPVGRAGLVDGRSDSATVDALKQPYGLSDFAEPDRVARQTNAPRRTARAHSNSASSQQDDAERRVAALRFFRGKGRLPGPQRAAEDIDAHIRWLRDDD